jgi:hypothetical protein
VGSESDDDASAEGGGEVRRVDTASVWPNSVQTANYESYVPS